MTPPKPSRRPERPWFSSGPTAKRPGWSPEGALGSALVGRGIRAPAAMARVADALERTRAVLEIPDEFKLVLIPGSDTGAMEAAMWSMLGARRVQALAYDAFGQIWAADVLKHLRLEAELLEAPFGRMADLSRVDPEADLVFVWNGTTAGVKVPSGEFIASDRKGLTFCDATSAAFAMDLPWDKLDVTTFSFQKALGGEAGIGMAVLSPRAIERLDAFTPDRPLPKLMRLHKDGRADRDLLEGGMINTYSLLVIEDWIDALRWAARAGGLEALKRRTAENFAVLSAWVERTPWVDFFCKDPAIRSETSVTLEFVDPKAKALSTERRAALAGRLCSALEKEGAALDVYSHRMAPPGLRIWCGCTVEASDLDALTPWLDWAYAVAAAELEPA